MAGALLTPVRSHLRTWYFYTTLCVLAAAAGLYLAFRQNRVGRLVQESTFSQAQSRADVSNIARPDVWPVLVQAQGHEVSVIFRDGRIASRDLTTRNSGTTELGGVPINGPSGVTAAAFIPGGRAVLSGDGSGELRLVRLVNGRHVDSIKVHAHDDFIASLTVAGRHVVSRAGNERNLKVWGADDLAQAGSIVPNSDVIGDSFSALAGVSTGDSVIGALSSERHVAQYELPSGRLVKEFDPIEIGQIDHLAVSVDAQYCIAGSRHGHVVVWRIADGSIARSGTARPLGPFGVFAVSPTGPYLIFSHFTGGGTPRRLYLLNYLTGEMLGMLDRSSDDFPGGPQYGPIAGWLAWTADGKSIVAVYELGAVRVWTVF